MQWEILALTILLGGRDETKESDSPGSRQNVN